MLVNGLNSDGQSLGSNLAKGVKIASHRLFQRGRLANPPQDRSSKVVQT